jgi:hypothetical protein
MCLLTIFSKVSDFAKGVIFRLLVLHITAQGDIVVKGFFLFSRLVPIVASSVTASRRRALTLR